MKGRIKKGDSVVVITGDDKGKKGKIIELSTKKGKVKVEGINIVTKHVKPRGQGKRSGIIQEEAFVDISNVMLLDTTTKKPIRACKRTQKLS